MKEIKLYDLVGRDVRGLIANIKRQGGKYHYDYQDIPIIRKLHKVYLKKVGGVIWLMWEWEAQFNGNDSEYDCGYSKIADSELHRIKDAYIKLS